MGAYVMVPAFDKGDVKLQSYENFSAFKRFCARVARVAGSAMEAVRLDLGMPY